MLVTTESVAVVDYGAWDEEQPKFGEWVRVKAPQDEATRRYSLSKEINGDRPAVGDLVTVTLLSHMKEKPFIAKDGSAQSRRVEAFKAVGFAPVK